MKIIAALNHPAHYHLFKNIVLRLKQNNHRVFYVIKNKDILETLLTKEKVKYHKIQDAKQRKNSRLSVLSHSLREIIIQDFNLFSYVKTKKPDLMVGTDTAITHIGKLLRIPTFVFNEDDYSINKLFCSFSYPYASYIVSPKICDVGRYREKKISYSGYQKLTYLHPSYFNPDKNIITSFHSRSEPYFLIRLVSFRAVHDVEIKHSGISKEVLFKLIDILSKKGRVFITTEAKFPKELEELRLKIDPTKIHHAMYYASLFISDSQSMTMEAAILGTPSVRFNSFAGKISVLEELEHQYGLTYGIHNKDPLSLYSRINELISNKDVGVEFEKRKQKMLAEKIDVASFFVWLIEKYPQSVKIMKENPDFQLRFRFKSHI